MNIESNFRLALHHFENSNFNDAANILQLVISNDKNNADAYHLLGVIEATRKNPEKGRLLIESSICINPNLADAHYHLGNILLMQLGKTEDAIQSFSKALSLNPRSLEALLNRGGAYNKLGMFEAALQDYQQISLIDPNLFDAHLRSGKIFLKLNRLNDALSDFRRAIECNCKAEEAYHGAAYILSQQGLFEESRVMYEKALRLGPESEAILANFGGLDLKLGNFRAGLEKIKNAYGSIEFNLINGISIK